MNKRLSDSNTIRDLRVAIKAVAISTFVLSCTENVMDEGSIMPEDEGVATQITLSVDTEADTRISINELAATWESDDVLYVYGADAAFEINADDAGSNSASFTGELTLEGGEQYIYAIYDPIKGGVNYSEDADGVKYTITQKTTQTQNIGTGGVNNPNSIGNQLYMYGKSTNQVDSDNTLSAITMHHTAAVQDFVFSNLPTDINGAMTKMIFSTTKPMLTDATVNLDSGEIVGGSSTISALSITVSPKADDDRSLLTSPTVRVAILPQTVVADAVWSICITMEDETQYEYTFGTASSDFDFVAGTCYQTSIDWNDMTEVVADTDVLVLASFTADDVADIDRWVFAESSVSDATDFDNLEAVLAEVKEANPSREITVVMSNLSAIKSNSFEGSLADYIELPKLILTQSALFKSATSLKGVSMPLVNTLVTSVFNGCSTLVSFNAPEGETGIYLDGITELGNYAIRYCYAVNYISAPDLVTVGTNSFGSCSALKSLSIPKLIDLSSIAMSDYPLLETLYAPAATNLGTNTFKSHATLKEVTLSSLETIASSLFESCTLLQSVNIDSATTIDQYAFRYCSGLESVEASSIVTINAQAFYKCSALNSLSAREEKEEIYLPNLTTTGNNVFTDCNSITTFSAPKVSTMGNKMFGGMESLRTLELATSVTSDDYVSYGSNIFGTADDLCIVDTENNVDFITGTNSFIASQISDLTWTLTSSKVYTFKSISYVE